MEEEASGCGIEESFGRGSRQEDRNWSIAGIGLRRRHGGGEAFGRICRGRKAGSGLAGRLRHGGGEGA
jgi:hypothetical protein